jgi:HEAT repeat protein
MPRNRPDTTNPTEAMKRRSGVNDRLLAARESGSSAELIAALDDPSPEVAKAAAARLAEVGGGEAAPELRSRLLRAEPARVGAIAAALRRLRDEAAVEAAIAGLHREPYTRRLAAARALAVFSDQRAAAALRAALRDPVGGVRGAALDALARLGTSEVSASECAPLLEDPVANVRLRAVEALARIARHPGRFLAVAAHDSDRQVRIQVARHAMSLPPEVAAALLSDHERRVREAAARGSGKDQLGALVAVVVDDPSSEVRVAAAQTLGELGDPRAVTALLPALEDADDVVRVAALRSLALLVTPAVAMELLRAELHSPSATRRRASVYALARMILSGESAECLTGDLARLVEDPDADVRLALIQTAELLSDPRPMVAYLTGDSDITVRHAAEMWLARRSAA